jgi:hypothetical protein
MSTSDIAVLRDLARQYADIAAKPVQDERRALWSRHNSLLPTRPLILATFGMWNVWCREVFADAVMKCQVPFYREYERRFRMALFQDDIGDDLILDPWVTVGAVQARGWGTVWGVREENHPSGVEGGAWKYQPVIRDWKDVEKLSWPPHTIDEAATARNADRLRDAVGDILTVNVDRGPVCQGFMADISTCLARLRGLEQIMIDMYESPAELHRLLAFMRDGILANQEAAEKSGDYSLTTQHNQEMVYCEGMERPSANSGLRQRRDLWAFSAAQEYTLISPAMHDEFLYQYQMPILRHYRHVAYGCCEDLTKKIDMLRQLPNLRVIAVTPLANVAKCAEQIDDRHVFSWRPNPTDMVCAGWDEARIRRIIGDGLQAARGCHIHLHLKDVETVQGDPTRLKRWVAIVRDVAGV